MATVIPPRLKSKMARLIGHLERRDGNRTAKKIYKGIPDGRRSVGAPRKRWIDDVVEDPK